MSMTSVMGEQFKSILLSLSIRIHGDPICTPIGAIIRTDILEFHHGDTSNRKMKISNSLGMGNNRGRDFARSVSYPSEPMERANLEISPDHTHL